MNRDAMIDCAVRQAMYKIANPWTRLGGYYIQPISVLQEWRRLGLPNRDAKRIKTEFRRISRMISSRIQVEGCAQ